jgi:hypothetical protein
LFILLSLIAAPVAASEKYIFITRDSSHPISPEEITAWTKELITSMHPSDDAKIFWSEPAKGGTKVNGKILEPTIIAYGFVISEKNGTFKTSTYTGKFSSPPGSAAEVDEEALAGINQKAVEWFNSNIIEKKYLGVDDNSNWPTVTSYNDDWAYQDLGEVNDHWALHKLDDDKRPDTNYNYYILESTYLGMNPHYNSWSCTNKMLYGDHIWSTDYSPELITVHPSVPYTGTTTNSIDIGISGSTTGASFTHSYTQGDTSEEVDAQMSSKYVDWSFKPNSDAAKRDSLGFTPASTYRVQTHDKSYRQIAQIYVKGVFNTYKYGEQYMEENQYINGNY